MTNESEDYYNNYDPDGLMSHKYITDHKEDNFLAWQGVEVTILVLNIIIFLLGVVGNGVVIWIAGLKMKKTVNTVWYLSLAVSDFTFCAFLPIVVAHMATREWIFGIFMCKFTSFIMFLNMFSSIFLLVIISVDRCVSVVMPVWAQNHRTVKKASVVVTLAWAVSAILSFPSVIFRDTRKLWEKTECFNNYSKYNLASLHETVVLSRFVCGFAVPFVIITLCYFIIFWKLKNNQMIQKSSKPFKVMSALIAAFFLCWLPYHIVVLMEASYCCVDMVSKLIKIFTTLASANSLLNPFLYAFMGDDFKQKCFRSLLSKIENAIGDEARTTSRYMSVSSSVDGKASTNI